MNKILIISSKSKPNKIGSLIVWIIKCAFLITAFYLNYRFIGGSLFLDILISGSLLLHIYAKNLYDGAEKLYDASDEEIKKIKKILKI